MISGISLAPVDPNMEMTKGKYQDYVLTFSLKNPLVTGNVITLAFPPAMAIVSTLNVELIYIVQGLNDISQFDTVAIAFNPTTNII